MNTNDKDKPLYSIDDDETPLYKLDEEEENIDVGESENQNSEEIEPSGKKISPLIVLFRIMLTPVEGWKILKRSRFKTDDFAAKCFYPLLACAALSDISGIFYEANFTVTDWVIKGFTTFITFFFAYFTIIFTAGLILPKQSRGLTKTDIGKQFVMIAMSTLTIFWILIQILPMIEPVLVFLPLWTIYLCFKGIRVIRVNKDVENTTTLVLCVLIIGIPLFWNWLIMEIFLPASL